MYRQRPAHIRLRGSWRSLRCRRATAQKAAGHIEKRIRQLNRTIRSQQLSAVYLKNQFQFDRNAKRQACNAKHDPPGKLLLSEDLEQHFGCAVCDLRVVPEIALGCNIDAELDDPNHLVQ